MKPTAMHIKYKVFQVSDRDLGNVVIVVKVFPVSDRVMIEVLSVMPPSQNSKGTTSAGIGKKLQFSTEMAVFL